MSSRDPNDRRRYANVAKPGGERAGDKIAARHARGARRATVPQSDLRAVALLWALAAMAGAAYGAGLLTGWW